MNSKGINLFLLNKVLIAVFLLGLLMYLGREFLIPLAVAAFFAMLLFPVARRFESLGMKKPAASLISILLLLVFLGMIVSLVYYQGKALKADLPNLENKIEQKTSRLQSLFSQKTDISRNEQEEIIEESKPSIVATISEFITLLLVEGLYLLLVTFIVLAYTFFFLLYRRKIMQFFIRLKLFDNQQEAEAILLRVAGVTHHYLRGVFIVISILAVLYFLGLWAIGLSHPLLFAIITALLRVVPYFGTYIGIAFPIAFAFLTKDAVWYPLAVLAFMTVIQLVEAYLLTPNITGPQVKLNPLATIMIILLGNLVWGVAGMVLFVPMFGILKIAFDEIPSLQPFGYILGKEE